MGEGEEEEEDMEDGEDGEEGGAAEQEGNVIGRGWRGRRRDTGGGAVEVRLLEIKDAGLGEQRKQAGAVRD